MATNINKIFSGYQLCQLVNNYRRFMDHHQSYDVTFTIKGTECLNQVIWLIELEDFVKAFRIVLFSVKATQSLYVNNSVILNRHIIIEHENSGHSSFYVQISARV